MPTERATSLAAQFAAARPCSSSFSIWPLREKNASLPQRQRTIATVVCRDQNESSTGESCISFWGLRVDRAVTQDVLDRVQPLGVEAAMAAMNDHERERVEKRRQLEKALEQARFDAARAYRQYDGVDPSNRLVAAELERRWNERLIKLEP